MTGLRVLVTGGRDYSDAQAVSDSLNRLDEIASIECVIHGGAPGADALGAVWAASRHLRMEAYPADWGAHGRAAGPIRNQRMIDEGKPDLVVAFPGGRGTADMVRRARAAGIEVIEVTGGEGR